MTAFSMKMLLGITPESVQEKPICICIPDDDGEDFARVISFGGSREMIRNEQQHGWALKKAAEANRPMSDIGAMRTYNSALVGAR